MGLVTNVLAVLVGIITPPCSSPGVAGGGHGQRPTLNADSVTPRVQSAALPGLEAAVPIILVGMELVSSAIAVTPKADTLITARLVIHSVVAGLPPSLLSAPAAAGPWP